MMNKFELEQKKVEIEKEKLWEEKAKLDKRIKEEAELKLKEEFE